MCKVASNKSRHAKSAVPCRAPFGGRMLGNVRDRLDAAAGSRPP